MPENKITSPIAAIYKRNALNLLMFGYVKGVRETIHTVTIAEALERFRVLMDIDPDCFNANSMAMEFNRMNKDIFNINSNKND